MQNVLQIVVLLLVLVCCTCQQQDVNNKVAFCMEFGTSGSAVASQWREHLTVFKQWPQRIGNYFKVPSVIKQFVDGTKKYGFEAVRIGEQKANTMYNIKMELRNKQNENSVQLIGDFLKYVYDKSVPALKQKYVHLDSDEQIQWIATIPAIWTELESSKMRRALAIAGLPVHNASRFLFIREPEAAAVHAIATYDVVISKPVTFMVIDAGAGTIDITVFTFDPTTRTFTELCVPMGNTWGSSKLDEEFFNQMENAYGKAFMDDLMQTNEYSRLRKEWIDKKHGMTADIAHENAFIQIVDKTPFEKHGIKIGINGLKLPFTYNDIYETVLQHVDILINEVIEKVLKENKLDFIFHVGGFALSDIYRNRVDTLILKFDPGMKFHTEHMEAQSVINGCTQYALLSQKYKFTRVMKYTYGHAIVSTNSTTTHATNCRLDNDGVTTLCFNTFEKICEAGELIPQGTVRIDRVQPLRIEQNVVSIRLFRSTDPKVVFTSDASVSLLGSLVLPLKEPATKNTVITISFHFGADIFVSAVDEKNRLLGEAAIQYL